jgi:phosphatidate cytidylyltransferase
MLLSNPLAYPLLPPLGLTLAGLFAGSLVALLVTVRGRWEKLASSVLFTRWRTWLLVAPLYTVLVLSGPLLVAVLAAALAVQGAREYGRLTDLPRADRRTLVAAAASVPLACALLPTDLLGQCALLLPLVASLPAMLAGDAEHGLTRVARLAFGLWYLPLSLGLLPLLDRDPRGGPGLLLALGLAVALSDVGAFAFGRLFGRRALAPRLSPSKTWAGLLGNFVGAALGIALLVQHVPSRVPLVALVVVAAIGAIWGDLLESLLKRAAAVKDSGAWLPGFGGLLDRLDSLLIVLPLAYTLLGATR